MHDRITQLNDLIRDIVSGLLARELALKDGVIVTIVDVNTARNLRSTRISVSVFPESERQYAMKTLEHEKWTLERLFHVKLATRPLPTLTFLLDTTSEEADKIEHLLKAIEGDKNQ